MKYQLQELFGPRPMEPSCQLAQLVLRLFLLCGMGSDQRYRALQDGDKIAALLAILVFFGLKGNWLKLLLSCKFGLPSKTVVFPASKTGKW